MIWFVLSLALLLRLALGLTRSSDNAAFDSLPDQREYLSIARNITVGQGAQFFDPRFEQTVYAYRLPGYPWFIAACACDPRIVRVVQALLDTSTVLAVFLLTRCLVNPNGTADGPGLAAAFLVAINPFLIYFSGLLLSEALFTAMVAWGMVLLVAGRSSSTLFWVSGVALLALSIQVRPSAIALPIISVIGATGVTCGPGSKLPRDSLFSRDAQRSASSSVPGQIPPGLRTASLDALRFASRLNRNPKRPFIALAVKRSIAAAALIVALLLPWAWRNSRPNVLGRWIWTSTNSGITAYDGWNPAASGGSDQAFVSHMPELRTMGEIERSSYLAGRARDFIVNHPQRAITLLFRKFGRLWSPMPLSEQYSSSAYLAVALLYSVPFDLLVLAGLIRGKLPRSAKVYLMIPAIYFTVVHMASVGSLRYLLPAIPSMSVLAGSVIQNLRPGRMG